MKNRTIFTLLLAVVVIVAVPVFAQDNSASQTQPATQSTSMQPAAPPATKADSATGKDPLQPETREASGPHESVRAQEIRRAADAADSRPYQRTR